MKRALITGITGMDGSHLADLLLEQGYEVHGIVRRCSRPILERISHVAERLYLYEGDLLDQTSLDRAVCECQPDEVYHLAAQTFVGSSWQQPVLTAEITGLGTLRMLEAVRSNAPEARFYQASSSEMFGNTSAPQTEETPLCPRSPYGAAKVFAHNLAVNYRESYGMHISCGILFNHESERRGSEFVTRKISQGVAKIKQGKSAWLKLGNLDAKRDWGYAPDYVRAMWLMLQQDNPGDYVVATGQSHTVEEFARAACEVAGLDFDTWCRFDPSLLRPAELYSLRGDAHRAQTVLGWSPQVGFETLVQRMVEHDLGAPETSAVVA